MILCKEVTIPEEVILEPEKKKCDRCKKEYFIEYREDAPDDLWEAQEFFHIKEGCGYGSIFGDLNTVECDLCQHCVKDVLDPFLRVQGFYIDDPNKDKPRRETSKPFYDYHKCRDWLQSKYSFRERDRLGRFDVAVSEEERKARSYQDFWHWVLDTSEALGYPIRNGCYFHMSLEWEEYVQHDWQR